MPTPLSLRRLLRKRLFLKGFAFIVLSLRRDHELFGCEGSAAIRRDRRNGSRVYAPQREPLFDWKQRTSRARDSGSKPPQCTVPRVHV
jgi:hypothetical protein